MTNAELLVGNCHEWSRWVNYEGVGDQDPLAPYFGLARVIDDCGGSRTDTVTVDGVEYSCQLWYRSGDDVGIGDLQVDRVQFESVREYHLSFDAVEDDLDAHSGTFHLALRSPDMVGHDGEPVSLPVPNDFVGLSVREQGSNLPFDRYQRLLQAWARSVGLDPLYFADEAIRSCRIGDASVEVRIHCDESGPLHATDGTISRMSELLSSDREGYRKHVADDRGRPGNYHTATIGNRRANELLTGHSLPKEVKHYYDDDAPRDKDRALAHPKLCVSYQTSLHDEKPTEIDAVRRELHEVLLNVLRWKGFPVGADTIDDWSGPSEADRGPYVEDAFWEPATERCQRRLTPDPLPEIREQQESRVVAHLVDGLEESDFDVLDRLVADGGEVSPADIVEDEGRHIQTIYRALDRLSDLVDHRYGEVHLTSHAVAEEVAEKVRWAREVATDAAETAAAALDRLDEMESGGDRVREWLEERGAQLEQRGDADRLHLDVGAFRAAAGADDLAVALTEFLYRWRRAGLDPDRLLDATVRYGIHGEYRTVAFASAMKSTG